MKRYYIEDIIYIIDDYRILGNVKGKFFTNAKPIHEAKKDSLVWLSSLRRDSQQLSDNTEAEIIICDKNIKFTDSINKKCLIQVDNPRLAFSKIIEKIFIKIPEYQIHPTAVIHPDAKIHKKVYIGPFTYIGKCTIKENVVVYGHCYIYDNVQIGKNVILKPGCTIGSSGFGYSRNEQGLPIKFPHIGKVIIEDEVEIGSYSSIDKGSLGNTVIGYGSKIDNLIHIGHNVQIGKCVYIAANTAIGGSSKIGDFVEIWMGCKIADGTKIGNNCNIGMGSVVINEVPENKKVFGNPARVYSSK